MAADEELECGLASQRERPNSVGTSGRGQVGACGLGAWRTIMIAVPVTLALLFATRLIDRLTNRNNRNH